MLGPALLLGSPGADGSSPSQSTHLPVREVTLAPGWHTAQLAPWCLLPAESMAQQQQDVVADLGGGQGQGWGA